MLVGRGIQNVLMFLLFSFFFGYLAGGWGGGGGGGVENGGGSQSVYKIQRSQFLNFPPFCY